MNFRALMFILTGNDGDRNETLFYDFQIEFSRSLVFKYNIALFTPLYDLITEKYYSYKGRLN